MDPVLQRAVDYLMGEVRPRAQEIDQDVEALKVALQGMCERDLMALKRPAAYGGPAMAEGDFRRFQEEVARVSGSLAFLQTQHQSAVSMLAKSENTSLKDRYLPKMGNGEKLVGIGFSQLRRPGPPIMRAIRVDGGYQLSGTVPWITGWSLYPEFLVGACLEGGESLFAVVPLSTQAGIQVAPPMRLAAMESAMTVSAEFSGWLVPDEDVAFIKPGNWIQNNDMINIALQGHFALGCARGALDVLHTAAEKRGASFLLETLEKLGAELVECKIQTTRAQRGEDIVTDERLAVRAWAIDLAVRCAHAAVTASSGAANSLSHPAQRIYREALVYTVSAQTTPIMEATLKRLIRG
jgi:alkylation response protein AidB-like acyl-CoA dehydrogenase